MSLGAMTKSAGVGEGPSAPTFLDLLQFVGDDNYTTGGTVGFQALVQTLVGDSREVLAVAAQDCGGFVVAYDKATDALIVYEAAADGNPLDEIGNGSNQSGVTYNVLVFSR